MSKVNFPASFYLHFTLPCAFSGPKIGKSPSSSYNGHTEYTSLTYKHIMAEKMPLFGECYIVIEGNKLNQKLLNNPLLYFKLEFIFAGFKLTSLPPCKFCGKKSRIVLSSSMAALSGG